MADTCTCEQDRLGGRPSDHPYTPEYCARVIELGEQGKSEVQIAVALGIPRTTMRSWAERHDEFRQALTRAKEASQAWWEDAAQSGHVGETINPAVWKHTVMCRFRDDYLPPQRVEQDHKSSDGSMSPRRIEVELVKPKGDE